MSRILMTGEPLFVERPCVIGMLPHGVRELPEGSFLGNQCNAPQDGGLSFSPAGAHGCALFVERSCVIGMLPHGVRELPEGSFLGNQCNAPQDGGLSFSPAGAHGCALREKKETPPLVAGVRCIGRSYRNRTYTMGVRGPCATTTPSSNAKMIIAILTLPSDSV